VAVYRAGLPRPAPGQPLELDQPADVSAEERQGGVHDGVIDRPDRLGLAGLGPPLLQPCDRGDGLVDGGWGQLLGHRPFEDPLDEGDPAVALGPTPPLRDPPLPGRLHAQRAKLHDGRVGVQLAEGPHHQLDLVDLTGRLADRVRPRLEPGQLRAEARQEPVPVLEVGNRPGNPTAVNAAEYPRHSRSEDARLATARGRQRGSLIAGHGRRGER